MVAIRTFAGEGTLELDGSAPIRLYTGTLTLIEQTRLSGYFCSGDEWEFWWFVFDSSDPMPCAFGTPYRIQSNSGEQEDFERTFTSLQNPSFSTRCTASATFTAMLHRWLAEAELSRSPSKHREVIERVIERIHADITDNWTLARLCWESGMCESLLRREFKKVTGKPPARFIHEARLQAASQLIQQGVYTLSAIAEMTNFSSAFHLSAAFKKHFGMPPSLLK